MSKETTVVKYDKFEKMDLKENLLRGIYAYGFETPSQIQAKAIVPICSGKDIIAQAQSGTGKTGTFVISTLQRVDEKVDGCQAIIVAHTIELANQISDVCKNLGSFMSIKFVLCVGGTNIQESRRDLEKGPCIVVGTPGRIIDMIEQSYLRTKLVKMLVIDEADELLSASFIKQIKTIVEYVTETTQICLFSATLSDEIMEVTKQFMNNPEKILVNKEELTLEGIKQFYVDVKEERWKFDTLLDLYELLSINQSIIYVNTRQRADWLASQLENKNFPVSVIHSDMTRSQRSTIMKDFKSGGTRILISTDLLARGIDVQQISIVINYDVPNLPGNRAAYLHRIGRSGRFGRKGVAINFITRRDFWKIKELNSFYSIKIEEMPKNIQDFI